MAVYLTISAYLLITLIIGFIGYKSANDTPEDYFLAGRKMGPFLLFFTFIATNFSAFFYNKMCAHFLYWRKCYPNISWSRNFC